MAPEIAQGREAREAWRALSPQARKAAFAAAKRGVAPADPGIAWAAAGYGRLMARRLRILRLFVPFLFVLLVLPVARSLGLRSDAVLSGLCIVVLAGLVALVARTGRYQRLHSSGLLGIQAAGLGMAAPATSPQAWQAVQSEFTVPYQARVPVAGPVARPVADAAAAGTREVPVRRGPVVKAFALLAGLGLIFWLAALAAPGTSVIAAAYTTVVGLLLYAAWPALRHPVLARFTPAGWDLPTVGMGGPWAGVREIRVRPISTRGLAGSLPLATYRAVALMVDNPDEQLARLPYLRRALVRRTMKRYGSPAVIVATPGRTIPLPELIVLLQHYTDAPVTWT